MARRMTAPNRSRSGKYNGLGEIGSSGRVLAQFRGFCLVRRERCAGVCSPATVRGASPGAGSLVARPWPAIVAIPKRFIFIDWNHGECIAHLKLNEQSASADTREGIFNNDAA